MRLATRSLLQQAATPRAAPRTPARGRAAPLARATDDSVTYSFTPASNGSGAAAPAAAATAAPAAPVDASSAAAAAPAAPRPEDFVWAEAPGDAEAEIARDVAAEAAASVTAAKIALLERIASLNRGALASDADKEQVASLLASLEAASFAAPRGGGAPALGLDGRWELLYSNVEAFRASPFFQAFTNVVDGLTDAAGLTGTINVGGSLSDAIFAFTDAIPNATIGAARQTLMPGSLVSEVDLTVFPGLKGTVVTTSRIASRSGGGEGGAAGPIVLELMVDNTRVERSNFSPFLDGIAVPVEQLIERVRGSDAARVVYEVTYLDANLRITRCGRQLMVHRRA